METEDEGSVLYGGIGFTSSAPPLDFRIHSVSQNSHWLNFNVSEGEHASLLGESWYQYDFLFI